MQPQRRSRASYSYHRRSYRRRPYRDPDVVDLVLELLRLLLHAAALVLRVAIHHPGPALFSTWAASAYLGYWPAATLAALVWLLYILLFSPMRCRVETKTHTPCRWGVRGVQGTCKYHKGLKFGIPKRTATGLMWTQARLAGASVPEPQPIPVEGRRNLVDWQLVVALLQLAVGIVGVALTW
jgi:hypothetical protein